MSNIILTHIPAQATLEFYININHKCTGVHIFGDEEIFAQI